MVRIVYKKYLYILNHEKVVFIDISSEMIEKELLRKIDDQNFVQSIHFNEKKPGSCLIELFNTSDKVPCLRELDVKVEEVDNIDPKKAILLLADE